MPLDRQLPDRIEDLSPTDLALAPFNDFCTDGDFLNRAALRFRQLATEYQAGRPITQVPSPLSSPSRDHPSSPTSFTRPQVGGSGRTFAADSCSFSWGDELARTIGPVEVKLEEDELVIAFKNQPLFNILASKLCFFLCKSLRAVPPSGFLTNAPSSSGRSRGRKSRGARGDDPPARSGRRAHGRHDSTRASLQPSTLPGEDPPRRSQHAYRRSRNLAATFWLSRFEPVRTPRPVYSSVRSTELAIAPLVSPATPTPSEGFAHIPPSPVNITFEYSLNTTHPSVPDPAVSHATPASGAQVERNAGGTARSQAIPAHLLQPLKDASGPFRYLSPSPAPPGWTAGCVTCQRRDLRGGQLTRRICASQFLGPAFRDSPSRLSAGGALLSELYSFRDQTPVEANRHWQTARAAG